MSAVCGCNHEVVDVSQYSSQYHFIRTECEHYCSCGVGMMKYREPHYDTMLVHCAACGKHVRYSRTRCN